MSFSLPSVFRLRLGTRRWYCTVNEAIRPKFLDLKESTLVISLEPFVAGGGRAVTERNVDDISAILDVSVQDYHSMDISSESGTGKFYVHRVDRAGYVGMRARFGAARRQSMRGR